MIRVLGQGHRGADVSLVKGRPRVGSHSLVAAAAAAAAAVVVVVVAVAAAAVAVAVAAVAAAAAAAVYRLVVGFDLCVR